MPYPYPTYAQGIPAATNVITIIKSGEVATRKAELAKGIYIVEGVALSFAVGEPTEDGSPKMFAAANQDTSVFCDMADTIQAELTVNHSDHAMYSASHGCYEASGDGVRKINWAGLLAFLKQWAPVILPLII